METKRTSQKGKYALGIGIIAGFAVLTLIFSAFGESSTDVMTGVAIVASLISVFVALMVPSQPKSCETDSKTGK